MRRGKYHRGDVHEMTDLCEIDHCFVDPALLLLEISIRQIEGIIFSVKIKPFQTSFICCLSGVIEPLLA